MSRPEPPNVLIVGAGIAGLFLAILLERQKVPYTIYERAKEPKPIGSAIGLDVKIMPVMEQLGLLEELKSISLPGAGVEMFDPQLKFMTAILFKGYEEVTGYVPLMFPRPELHRLLRSHVPVEKIIYSKKVLSLEQNDHGAMLRMSDGTTVHGDIVVGADGTYSGVRQGLYKHLEKKDLLPASDREELTLGHLCMVGTTNPVDPEKYPCVNNEKALFQRVIGKGDPYTWHTVNMRGNKICWGIICQMDSTVASRDKLFRNSDWGSEGDEGVMSGAFDKPTPIGGTVRDLFEATPKEEISKVFLEEKLFETWYYGRTVLIGDACHKFLPSAGQGAVNAMQDAVVLANRIYEMGEATPENITAAFKEYRDERYGPAKRLMAKSKLLAILQYGMTWRDRLIRYIMFNLIPNGIKMKQFYKDTMHRPQVSYLEYVEAHGTGEVLPQKPSKRYAQEKAAAKGEEVAS